MSPSSEPPPGSLAPGPSEALGRRFARLTFFNILANLTVPLAGLIDAAILGHLDRIEFLAGVALGSIVFDYVFWSFGFLRMATTGMTAQSHGRGDPQAAERVLRRALILAAASGTVIVLFRGPLADLAFGLLSGAPETEAAGRAYYGARIWGAPAALLNLCFLGWFLGREESRIALYMTAAANLANIALDYLFILEFGWAAEGAGLATMASQYLQLAVALVFFLPRRTGAGWDWARLLDRDKLAKMFRLQRDILFRTLLLVSAIAVFTDASARLGTDVLAANTLLLRLFTVAAYLIDGVAYAVESLAGVLYGADERGLLRRMIRWAMLVAVGFALLFVAPLLVAPSFTLGLLTSHEDIVRLGAAYSPWLVPVLVIGALAFVYDGLFLGLTAGKTLRNSMILSAGLYLPCALWAVHQQSAHLLWASFALFMVARTVTLGWADRHLDVAARKPRPGG